MKKESLHGRADLSHPENRRLELPTQKSAADTEAQTTGCITGEQTLLIDGYKNALTKKKY